jgi:hypothetical protein
LELVVLVLGIVEVIVVRPYLIDEDGRSGLREEPVEQELGPRRCPAGRRTFD